MWTPAFDRFVEPARAAPQVWRLAVGLLLVILAWMAGVVALLGAAVAWAGAEGLPALIEGFAATSTPLAVLALLGTFAGMLAGPLLAARWLHRRRARSLFGPGLARGFATGAGITVAIFALATLLLPAPVEVVRNLPAAVWLAALPLGLLGLLLQTGAEEVLFRGYLQTQLAARFRSPVAWMALPAILFGALHYDPASAGGNAGWIVAAATLFGLVAADLTRVTGSIGAAWGLHFANNASAILVVSVEGSLSGLSFWTIPTPVSALSGTVLAQDLTLTVIVWASIRLWLARRARAA